MHVCVGVRVCVCRRACVCLCMYGPPCDVTEKIFKGVPHFLENLWPAAPRRIFSGKLSLRERPGCFHLAGPRRRDDTCTLISSCAGGRPRHTPWPLCSRVPTDTAAQCDSPGTRVAPLKDGCFLKDCVRYLAFSS